MDNDKTRAYETPQVIDHGRLQDLTANDGTPVVTDVPGGTPVGGNIVGSHYSGTP